MKALSLSITLVALLASTSLPAQRVGFDLRGAAAMPAEKLAGAELDNGIGVGATLSLRLQSHLHMYGGWDWLHFGANQSFAGADLDFEETGYTFGLRFDHPFQTESGAAFRIEAGGTLKHVEIEDQDGDLIADSGHDPGFELGAGLRIPIGAAGSLVPMLRFRSLATEFTIGSVTTKADLRYYGLEVGFSRWF